MKDQQNDSKNNYHHGDLKAVLLDETARILREEGEAALSLRRLAANIGVSRTAPYHHFKDKNALLSGVAEEGFNRFNAAIAAGVKKGKGLPAQGQMFEYVKAYVNFAVDNPEYYDLMFGGKLWRSSDLSESMAQLARGILRRNVQDISSLQDEGRIDKKLNALRYSQVTWGTLHGISRMLIDGLYVDRASIEAMCETAAEILSPHLRSD